MKTAYAIIAVMLLVSSCSWIDSMDEKPELTSPCVGLEDSPCGPKRPVNLWLYGRQEMHYPS